MTGGRGRCHSFISEKLASIRINITFFYFVIHRIFFSIFPNSEPTINSNSSRKGYMEDIREFYATSVMFLSVKISS